MQPKSYPPTATIKEKMLILSGPIAFSTIKPMIMKRATPIITCINP